MGRGVTAAPRLALPHRRERAAAAGGRRRRGDGPPGAEADAAAESVLQLAVLLQAGLAPARAWTHLAQTGDAAASHVVAAHRDGSPLPEAIAGIGTPVWREIAAAYKVASVVGAPLADSLRGLAVALRDAHEAADDVRVALAEPAGTARLMGWLPLVALGLGALLGFDMLGALMTNPLGIASLVAGGILLGLARRWTGRLVARARAEGGIPGLDAELVAIALSGGVSIDRAHAVVRDARAVGRSRPVGAAGSESAVGARVSESAGDRAAAGVTADVARVLSLARSAGVPAVELLRASAAHARHRARIHGRLRAARLSSRLLIPLGVCTLPAFLLLGVAPMLLSVMSTMSLTL